jgi:DNA replication and repair protein RecF
LDAIYYLSFTKSYFNSTDALNTAIGFEGFRLEAFFNNNHDTQKVVCVNRNGAKKEFYLNDVLYEKLVRHIGLFPAVMIAPDDIEIINGASELRRKFIDTVLCQLDPDYLSQLIIYNKVLQQRNSFLKQAAEKNKLDYSLLEILNEQLTSPAKYIFDKRSKFAINLVQLVNTYYQQIAQVQESITINYSSKLFEMSFDVLLQKNIEKDRIMQRTTVGIHKDDIEFMMNEQSFKNIASQGQKKSLLFALKLAEYEIIKNAKGFSPLLLLDDVFEKLDDERMKNLLRIVSVQNHGQVFITDTHLDRLQNAFTTLAVEAQIITL